MDKTALPFIVTTPIQKQTRCQNRQIRSHAAKVSLPLQRPRKPKSRVSSTQSRYTRAAQRALAPAERPKLMPTPIYTPIFRLGTGIASSEGTSSPLTPRSLQIVTTFFSLVSLEMYPKELCIGPDRNNDVYWVGTVFHDQVYLHAILAATEVFFGIRAGNHTPMPCQHSVKALQGLQSRLSIIDNSDCFSDATILSILALAIAADLSDNMPTVERHLHGLKRIIDMKGGIEGLRTSIPDLLAKICRLDLGLAVRTWRPTVFFHKSISWDPYLITSHSFEGGNDHRMSQWADDNLETRLYAIWEDLRQFRRMSVSASRTNQKLPRVMFSELMLSLLYRLVNLSYDLDSPNEVVRLGILAYVSSIFLQWGKKAEFHHLRRMLAETFKGFHTGIFDIPLPGKLWLFFTWHLLQPAENEVGTWDMWLVTSFCDEIPPSWSDVQLLLRSTVWIGHMHDVEGEVIYQRTIKRVS